MRFRYSFSAVGTDYVIKFFAFLCFCLVFSFLVSEVSAQTSPKEVRVFGALKNVMWRGELHGIIDLDSLNNIVNLYGMGPVEYLTGEITIWEGKSFISTTLTDTSMLVEETFDIKAPFFGYAVVENWSEILINDSVTNLKNLELFLDKITSDINKPFFFKIQGLVDSATIHIMNLPPGTRVSSPEVAHSTQVDYFIKNEWIDVIGFFSRNHQTIFTHHDSFLHMHLITRDRKKMGHLDRMHFTPLKVQLYIAAD